MDRKPITINNDVTVEWLNGVDAKSSNKQTHVLWGSNSTVPGGSKHNWSAFVDLTTYPHFANPKYEPYNLDAIVKFDIYNNHVLPYMQSARRFNYTKEEVKLGDKDYRVTYEREGLYSSSPAYSGTQFTVELKMRRFLDPTTNTVIEEVSDSLVPTASLPFAVP